jgi:hypothetical protein
VRGGLLLKDTHPNYKLIITMRVSHSDGRTDRLASSFMLLR